ncbi:MAG: hypothetical protein WCM76_02655 [Bacteroidota bacterium]
METKIAKIISYICHPLFVPTLVFIVLINLNIPGYPSLNTTTKFLVLSLMISATVLLPVVLFSLFRRKGIIRSFQMETREERIYPYGTVAIIYYAAFTMFRYTGLQPLYSFYLLNITLLVLIVLIINIWWKISVHMVALGGATGVFIGLGYRLGLNLQSFIIPLILASGLTAYARLHLDAHKPAQVYIGYCLGLIPIILIYLMY